MPRRKKQKYWIDEADVEDLLKIIKRMKQRARAIDASADEIKAWTSVLKER